MLKLGSRRKWVEMVMHVHEILDPHFCQPDVAAFTQGGVDSPLNIAHYSGVYQWWYTIESHTNGNIYIPFIYYFFL
jgi:photosystem I P700 chlorophyll a apoprotein A2